MLKGIYKHTEEAKKKMRGRKFSKEHIEKLRNSHLGQIPWCKGKKLHYDVWCKGKKCPQLSGKNHHNWKGGKWKAPSGYIMFYCAWHKNHVIDYYVLEHRFVVEKHLDRYLTRKEVVHHINGIKDDNRIKNLMLFKSNRYHIIFHKCGYVDSKYIVFNGRNINKKEDYHENGSFGKVAIRKRNGKGARTKQKSLFSKRG